MKIPDKIRIGGIEYTIIHESQLNDGQVLLAEQIRPMDCVIALAADSNHEYKCLTLWHEIMHGIEEEFQIELGENSEHIIEAFARGVYQTLRDNAGRLYDLQEDEWQMSTFPERLRRVRESRHMKRIVLADMCGISRNMIARYESGVAVPGSDVLSNMADVFDTSTDYLLGRTNYPGRIL